MREVRARRCFGLGRSVGAWKAAGRASMAHDLKRFLQALGGGEPRTETGILAALPTGALRKLV